MIVAGSRNIDNEDIVFSKLDQLLAKVKDHDLEIVSGLARGPDKLGRFWAIRNNVNYSEWPADWDGPLKMGAGFARNVDMVWYSTHLIAFYDGVSKGTKSAIGLSKLEGLNSRIILMK